MPDEIIETPASRSVVVPEDVILPLVPTGDMAGDVQEIEEDYIYRAVKEAESPDTILQSIMEGFAEEQFALRTYRKVQQNKGKSIIDVSGKRGQILKFMSETVIDRKALSGPTDDLNIRGVKFKEVFKLFLDTIATTIDEVKIPQEYRDMFFQRLSKNLEGWEDKAEKIIKAIEAPRA
jgi:hypothetical protein